MAKSKDKIEIDKQKLQHVVNLLKFSIHLDDEEIVKSTVESVVELIEEMIK